MRDADETTGRDRDIASRRSEPAELRGLEDAVVAMRDEVAVRPAWRDALLASVGERPGSEVPDDVRDGPARGLGARDHRWWSRERGLFVVRPAAGVAAALAFSLLGAGTVLTLQSLTRSSSTLAVADKRDAALASAADTREVRFVLRAPGASRVSLVGDFNRWNPLAQPLAQTADDGSWSVTVPLAPGRHVYAFVVDGDVTADPAAPRSAEEDFGSPSSVILVAGPRS